MWYKIYFWPILAQLFLLFFMILRRMSQELVTTDYIPSPLAGAGVVAGSVVAGSVVDGSVVAAVVVISSHCSRLGCLGPDTLLHFLAPVSRMVQVWEVWL